MGLGGGSRVVDDDSGCRVAHEAMSNPPPGMRRNRARIVWFAMTLAFAAFTVVPTLWLGLATPDCAPADQGVCSFGQALAVAFALGVAIVIGLPLTVGSAILWLTRKKYLPEAGDE